MWFNWKATILMALNDDNQVAVIFTFSVYWCAQKDIKHTNTHTHTYPFYLFCLVETKVKWCLSLRMICEWVASPESALVYIRSTAFHTTIKDIYMCTICKMGIYIYMGIKRDGVQVLSSGSQRPITTQSYLCLSKRPPVIIYLFFDLTERCAVVCVGRVLPTSFGRNRIFFYICRAKPLPNYMRNCAARNVTCHFVILFDILAQQWE